MVKAQEGGLEVKQRKEQIYSARWPFPNILYNVFFPPKKPGTILILTREGKEKDNVFG